MMDHTNEIVIGAVGLITTAAGWFLGGKQSSKRSDTEVVSAGAEKLIQSGQELLNYLTAQRERAEHEKGDCVKKLQEQSLQIAKQNLRIEAQEKEMKKMQLKIQKIKQK